MRPKRSAQHRQHVSIACTARRCACSQQSPTHSMQTHKSAPVAQATVIIGIQLTTFNATSTNAMGTKTHPSTHAAWLQLQANSTTPSTQTGDLAAAQAAITVSQAPPDHPCMPPRAVAFSPACCNTPSAGLVSPQWLYCCLLYHSACSACCVLHLYCCASNADAPLASFPSPVPIPRPHEHPLQLTIHWWVCRQVCSHPPLHRSTDLNTHTLSTSPQNRLSKPALRHKRCQNAGHDTSWQHRLLMSTGCCLAVDCLVVCLDSLDNLRVLPALRGIMHTKSIPAACRRHRDTTGGQQR